MIEHHRFFIGGEWRAPSGTRQLEVISPMTEEVIARVPLGTPADIAAAVAAARAAFDSGPWPRMSLDDRRAILMRAGQLLDPRADELSDLITNENGTLRSLEKGRCRPHFTYNCALDLPVPIERVSPSGAEAIIVHEPVGVVAAISPWNGAGGLSLHKLLPALLTGCTVVLKPAPETPLDTYILAEAFAEAGLPPGCLNIVVADRDVSEELVKHGDVDLVSFTGSTAAGRRIGAICGEQVKRAYLELGGKSAAIILDDADLAVSMPLLMAGGMLFNNGEACAAWTRILAPTSRHDEVVDAISEYLAGVRVGDPFDPDVHVGPLVAERQRERVEGYIKLAQTEGAKVAVGGGRPASLDRGWYVEPTLLVNANNNMRSSREEIFGPVASVIPYQDEAEAVRIANDSSYGLSGAVITTDTDRGVALAKQIRSGTVGVNAIGIDVAFPFGGYKESGMGRQHGPEGLLEYTEMKTIALPVRR